MDSNKVIIVAMMALVAVFALWLGFKFVADHWEDIKALAIIALVLGGTFSVVVGGLKLRAGR